VKVRWEYLFILVDRLGMFSSELLPHYINGREIRNWKNGKSIEAASNELGENGWELVASNPIVEGDPVYLSQWLYIFKRPKQ